MLGFFCVYLNFRFWHKADIQILIFLVGMFLRFDTDLLIFMLNKGGRVARQYPETPLNWDYTGVVHRSRSAQTPRPFQNKRNPMLQNVISWFLCY